MDSQHYLFNSYDKAVEKLYGLVLNEIEEQNLETEECKGDGPAFWDVEWGWSKRHDYWRYYDRQDVYDIEIFVKEISSED